jgi:NADH-quinone oxidoreductase subunit N
MGITSSDFLAILPLIVLVTWGLALLLVDLWVPAGRKWITALLAAAGLAGTMVLAILPIGYGVVAFNQMVVADGFARFLNVLFLGSGIAGIALAYEYLQRMGIQRGEYYSLLIFSVSGMMLMAYAADLIVVFLALELLSIPLYVLAGFARQRLDSEEAALKYFLLGAFAAGFVLYGVAMVFGATGHTGLAAIAADLKAGTANPILFLVGAGLLLVGFGFKVAAAPFHMWMPDVYQGAPSPVTGFMSVGAKAAGFAALLRVFVTTFPSLSADLAPVLWVLAALTMLVGNVAAIVQGNIKRMLAYSSIAHAGYLLMALVPYGQKSPVSDNAVASVLFYLLAYSVTSLGAWAVVSAVEKSEGRGLELADYAGLGRKYPLLAVAMLVFLLSFTGVPPTLGFWGKFYLFRTAIEGGYISLAIIGLLTSLASAYYYLRVVVTMYMQPGEPEVAHQPWLNVTAAAAALATVLLGLLPGPLFALAVQAVLHLF